MSVGYNAFTARPPRTTKQGTRSDVIPPTLTYHKPPKFSQSLRHSTFHQTVPDALILSERIDI